MKKLLALSIIIGSPICLALMTIAVPKILLVLFGLLLLGVLPFSPGLIVALGILSLLGGALRLGLFGDQDLANVIVG